MGAGDLGQSSPRSTGTKTPPIAEAARRQPSPPPPPSPPFEAKPLGAVPLGAVADSAHAREQKGGMVLSRVLR